MVRKRKNSEETAPAVPRLTRQRRNLDEEEDPDATLVEKSSKPSRTPKTPSMGRRNTKKKNLTANEDLAMSTRSRRVRAIKSSSDSDIENKADEPKHKINRGELLGVDNYPTRLRARKDGNATIQGSINTDFENNEAERKRQTKKKRVLTAADNTLTEDQSPSKSLVKLTRSQAKTVNPVPDPPGLQIEKTRDKDSPVERKNAKSSLLRSVAETPRKVSSRRQSSSLIKISADTVTPESSPMLINLTPHRSSKTPKKSPMNLGSPKTHSQSPSRLSKTPRKLTVTVESPATSDRSSVSLSNQSPAEGDFANENKRIPVVMLTDFVKEASPKMETLSELEEGSEKSPTNFVSVAKLRLRKSGQKSPANRNNKSPQKSAAASSRLTVDQIWAEVSATSPKKRSPNKKAGILGSKIRKSPIKTSASVTPTNKRPSFTPTKTPPNLIALNAVNPESPKRPKSTSKKRSPITSSGTPLRPMPERRESLTARSVASPSIMAVKKNKLLLELGNFSPESTPRGRIRRSLHLTPDFIKFSSGSTSSPVQTPKKTDRISSPLLFRDLGESKTILDESLELVDGSKFMNVSEEMFVNSVASANGMYELIETTLRKEGEENSEEMLEKEEVKDATYELAEPKTPNLKKQSRKRSLANVEPEKCTPEAKKRCRVRFASPAQEKTTLDSPAGSVRKSLPTVNTPAKQRIGGRLSKGNRALDNTRRRSRSLTKIDPKTPPTRTAIKRRSISASDVANKTPKLSQSTQNSVNRLSRPRQSVNSEVKLDVKLPVARRAPNFAQIHQKKFAEMESLVDAKKRVTKRHEELKTLTSNRSLQSSSAVLPEHSAPQPSKKPVPLEAQNGPFNRFGFKLRKAEAIKLITKNPAAALRSKNQQENNRSILKGVRTNRRFELQMKARQINNQSNNNK